MVNASVNVGDCEYKKSKIARGTTRKVGRNCSRQHQCPAPHVQHCFSVITAALEGHLAAQQEKSATRPLRPRQPLTEPSCWVVSLCCVDRHSSNCDQDGKSSYCQTSSAHGKPAEASCLWQVRQRDCVSNNAAKSLVGWKMFNVLLQVAIQLANVFNSSFGTFLIHSNSLGDVSDRVRKLLQHIWKERKSQICILMLQLSYITDDTTQHLHPDSEACCQLCVWGVLWRW